MIPPKIKAIFQFIEYLHSNIDNSKKYDDVIKDMGLLKSEKNNLRPKENFKDKLKYNEIQKQFEVKAKIINENIFKPIIDKVRELEICNFYDIENTLYNWNSSEVHELIRNFSNEDLPEIFSHKKKYLEYRTETKDELIYPLGFFYDFDQTLKPLFDYFKEIEQNEFEAFETKEIQIDDIVKSNKLFQHGKPVKLALPKKKYLIESTLQQQNENQTSKPPQKKGKTKEITLNDFFINLSPEQIENIQKHFSHYKGLEMACFIHQMNADKKLLIIKSSEEKNLSAFLKLFNSNLFDKNKIEAVAKNFDRKIADNLKLNIPNNIERFQTKEKIDNILKVGKLEVVVSNNKQL